MHQVSRTAVRKSHNHQVTRTKAASANKTHDTLRGCLYAVLFSSHTFEPHQISYDISAFHSSPDNWRGETIRTPQALTRSRFCQEEAKKEKEKSCLLLH